MIDKIERELVDQMATLDRDIADSWAVSNGCREPGSRSYWAGIANGLTMARLHLLSTMRILGINPETEV